VSGVLKIADQSELLTLKREQTTLLDSIDQEDSSQGKRIQRIAEIIEQRINLGDLDCDYPVNQISTQLKRILEGKPIASFLHRYLPDKYKDPRDQENAKLAEHLTSGRLMVCQRIDDLSNEQLERYFESRIEYDDMLDNNIRVNNKEIERCQQIAEERHLELGGYKFRKPISIHDIKGEVVETLEGLNEATYKNVKQSSKYLDKIAEVYKEFPATDYDDAKKFYLGTAAFNTVLAPHQDFKWTGDYAHWFDRGYLEVMQGKHGSGNSDKFMSILCTWCSRDIDDDPNDYERMYMDKESPTGYRCRNCGGVNFIERETTREQVGDRKEYIFNTAKDVLENFPFFADFLHDHNKKYVMPYENARKLRISGQFSNSAIAGTDTKVIKSKVK
jgi:hypothetical protein